MAEYGSDPKSTKHHDPNAKMEGGGYVTPEFEWMGEKSPAFEELRRKLSALTYSPTDPALPIKYRELIAAVVLAVVKYPTIEVHLRRALQMGASMQELVEAMQVAAIPGGMPIIHFAIPYLMRLEEEMKGTKV